MKYTYEFIKVVPENLFLQVKYSSEGRKDIIKNYTVKDFSEENLRHVAEAFASVVVEDWEALEANTNSNAAVLEGTATAAEFVTEAQKTMVTKTPPDFDNLTQKVEPLVTETETEITHGWKIVELNDAEKLEALNNWRRYMKITPRQARLALETRGLLDGIDAIIDTLPAGQDKLVRIEWEYATTVERKSPWVNQLGGALGLDDVGLDDLFKLAATL